MTGEWKSINKIMVEVAIPETTARRYLSSFSEFFTVKQFNKVKKYRDDAGTILRRIAELYELKKTTTEIRAILKAEGVPTANASSTRGRQTKEEVKWVEAEIHQVQEPMANDSLEVLSKQNQVIMATLQELAAGIKMINDQREEISLLKREIKELRLQFVSLSTSSGGGVHSATHQWGDTTKNADRSAPPVVVADDTEQDVGETSEHIDEVVPNEPVVLPRTVDRQQLADIIAELRANEPLVMPSAPSVPPTPPPTVMEEPPSPVQDTPPPVTKEQLAEVLNELVSSAARTADSGGQNMDSEASILLEKSYTPPTSADDPSNLSRVNSRSTTRSRHEEKKWWQFWK